MMNVIYRARCSCTEVKCYDEITVFIEAVNDYEARAKLTSCLAAIWNVSASTVNCYNLNSEHEIHKEAYTSMVSNPPLYGTAEYDNQQFETGWSGGEDGYPLYLKIVDWPLFLVSPRNYQHLNNAFLLCKAMEGEGKSYEQ